LKTGGGNHRGSVLRKVLGFALIAREGGEFPTWGEGRHAERAVAEREHPLESAVSTKIADMHVLWVRVEDPAGSESLRAHVKKNAIALLSNFRKSPVDPPSRGWLGLHSHSPEIRDSGLWNRDYVDDVYDPAFIESLDELV
jgi:hypothetical protein